MTSSNNEIILNEVQIVKAVYSHPQRFMKLKAYSSIYDMENETSSPTRKIEARAERTYYDPQSTAIDRIIPTGIVDNKSEVSRGGNKQHDYNKENKITNNDYAKREDLEEIDKLYPRYGTSAINRYSYDDKKTKPSTVEDREPTRPQLESKEPAKLGDNQQSAADIVKSNSIQSEVMPDFKKDNYSIQSENVSHNKSIEENNAKYPSYQKFVGKQGVDNYNFNYDKNEQSGIASNTSNQLNQEFSRDDAKPYLSRYSNLNSDYGEIAFQQAKVDPARVARSPNANLDNLGSAAAQKYKYGASMYASKTPNKYSNSNSHTDLSVNEGADTSSSYLRKYNTNNTGTNFREQQGQSDNLENDVKFNRGYNNYELKENEVTLDEKVKTDKRSYRPLTGKAESQTIGVMPDESAKNDYNFKKPQSNYTPIGLDKSDYGKEDELRKLSSRPNFTTASYISNIQENQHQSYSSKVEGFVSPNINKDRITSGATNYQGGTARLVSQPQDYNIKDYDIKSKLNSIRSQINLEGKRAVVSEGSEKEPQRPFKK